MTNQGVKLVVIAITLLTPFGVLGWHSTGRIWPWVPGAALVSATAILLIMYRYDVPTPHVIGAALYIGVSLRISIYLMPASMIGFDPGKYAVGVLSIMKNGDIASVADGISVYAQLSLFYLHNATTGLVTGVEERMVLISIPVAFGLILPLTAALITRRLIRTHQPFAVVAAATVAAVAPLGVVFAYMPIVQSLSVILWCILFITADRFLTTDDNRFYLAFIVLGTASIIGHKTSVLIPFLTISAAVLIWWTHPTYLRSDSRPRVRWLPLLFLGAIGIVLQWSFVTAYFRTFFLGIAVPLVAGGTSVFGATPPATAATPHLTGPIGILYRSAAWLPLYALSAVSWPILWFLCSERSPPFSLVLGGVGMMGLLTAMAVIGVSVSTPHRLQLYALPIAIPLIITATVQFAQWAPIAPRHITSAIAFVAIVLLALQAPSSHLAPDHSNTPRLHLNNEEVVAKNFAADHLGQNTPVVTDYYYADQQTRITAAGSYILGELSSGQTIPASGGYLNGTLASKGYEAILIRTSVESYRLRPGWYVLEYSPEALMDSSQYGRVYDNSGEILYRANVSHKTAKEHALVNSQDT